MGIPAAISEKAAADMHKAWEEFQALVARTSEQDTFVYTAPSTSFLCSQLLLPPRQPQDAPRPPPDMDPGSGVARGKLKGGLLVAEGPPGKGVMGGRANKVAAKSVRI